MLLKAGTFTLENSVTCVVSVDDNLFLFFRYFNPMWLSLRDLFIVTIYFIIVVDYDNPQQVASEIFSLRSAHRSINSWHLF